jgi:hypothetical protein
VCLVFGPADGVEAELAELVRLERECCAFAEWRIDRRGDELVLDVSANDATGAKAIQTMFAESREAAQPSPLPPATRHL